MKSLFTLTFVICLTLQASAQSAAFKQNTQWLENKLNTLVIDDDDKKLEVNGKKSHPTFKFNACQMLMLIQANDDKFSMNMNISWLLKDVTKVSYKKGDDGNYAIVLNVPPDRMKVDMGFGNDNSVSGSFNLGDDKKAKDKNDNQNSFSLATKDEKLIQEMVKRFESCIAECKK
jgi:hypothetical protein